MSERRSPWLCPAPSVGAGFFYFPFPVSTYDDFRARKEGAGHLVLPPIASTNYQAIFQISPSSLNKTRDQHAKSPVVLRSWAPTRSARRGVRVRRPTRPAGHGLHSSEQPMSPGTGRRPGLGCTLRREENALEFRRTRGHPAKYWRDGSRSSCYGSTGRSCYGSPSGRSPVIC